MGSRFLTENRWLLKLCAEVARFCGLLALLGTGVLVAVTVVVQIMFGSEGSGAAAKSYIHLWAMTPTIVFYGFLALILAEFISYLLADQGEPKWILRHGDKIIYAYVLYFIVMSVIGMAPQITGVKSPSGTGLHGVLPVALFVTSSVVKALIWVGIAIVLRKIVPIIRESKTLV